MTPESKLFVIKIIHTIIWLVFVTAIGFVGWSGLSGNITVYSWLAVASVIIEGIVLMLFRGYCPLTVLARRYSSSQKANFDIFLPNVIARYNRHIFTSLFLIGVGLMMYRWSAVRF